MRVEENENVDDFLEHFGVKGMKWGVRKDRDSNPIESFNNDKVRIGRDGSIDIQAGASLQRLVRSNGRSMPMKDMTYASINEYDNRRYIKFIGSKGFLGGGRDQILTITATKPIKAPSVEEAARIVSERMLSDAKFREKNTNIFGHSITDKELAEIRKDPVGKVARAWYMMTNIKLAFDKDFDPDAPFVQKIVREDVLSRGFNALRDENDAARLAKAPVIIFEPEKLLKVTSITDITDDLRKANKDQLKEYKRAGKEWLDEQIYGGKGTKAVK